VTSSDVNGYLREISGREVTAKDFRTWAATVGAARALVESGAFGSMTQAKRNVRAAIERVAACLGNTPTICRKCYIHPEVVNAYLEGGLLFADEADAGRSSKDELTRLRPDEAALLAMLKSRLTQPSPSRLAG